MFCSNATLSFTRSYPASQFQHLMTGCHVICLCVLSLLITRRLLSAPGNTCCRFDHTLKLKEQYCPVLYFCVTNVVRGEKSIARASYVWMGLLILPSIVIWYLPEVASCSGLIRQTGHKNKKSSSGGCTIIIENLSTFFWYDHMRIPFLTSFTLASNMQMLFGLVTQSSSPKNIGWNKQHVPLPFFCNYMLCKLILDCKCLFYAPSYM